MARAGSGGAREREEAAGGHGESARGDVPGGRSTADVPGGRSTAVPESGPVREAVGGTAGRLLSRDEGDKWTLRLQHAVAGFVDGPRDSVEEADQVLQEVAARFTDAVTERRRTLRTSWQTTGEDKADTEQLRLALRDYRELAERLLRL
nr:hypothetical protein [Streptomyces albicerus]